MTRTLARQPNRWSNPTEGQTITKSRAEIHIFPTSRIMLTEHLIEWNDKVQQRLNHLCSLGNGWDGYNGRSIKFEVGYFAIELLQRVCTWKTPEPSIVPLSSGGLQIEWHLEHIDIEITIRAPYNVNVWVYETDGDEDGVELPHLTKEFTSLAQYIHKLG